MRGIGILVVILECEGKALSFVGNFEEEEWPSRREGGGEVGWTKESKYGTTQGFDGDLKLGSAVEGLRAWIWMQLMV